MKILLTNDDSHDSPLLQFAIERFGAMGDLQVVVPKAEQSWKGKAMTRLGALALEEIVLDGTRAYCLDGTPADCANFGIYHLFEDKPDLVISGINMGSNTGLGFAFSSGTIGAALEGNIAGVPAVALSQILDREAFQSWMGDRTLPDGEQNRLFEQAHILLDRVFEMLLNRADFWTAPVTWNVNLPSHAAADWQVVRTFLGETFYRSCFKKVGDHYEHDMDRPVIDTREQSDAVVVRQQGHVSVTRLDIRTFGQL